MITPVQRDSLARWLAVEFGAAGAEIREVAPGLYLGKVWWGRRRVLDVALARPVGTAARVASPSER